MAKSRVPKRLSKRRSSSTSGQLPSTTMSAKLSSSVEKVSDKDASMTPSNPSVTNPSVTNPIKQVSEPFTRQDNRDKGVQMIRESPIEGNRINNPRLMVPPTEIPQPSTLQTIVNNINQSKYFAGIIMILMNMGSRYISLELSERHESILGHPMVRRLMLFTVFFTATRDVWISLGLTACFVILVTGIFHDESRFCMIPERYRKGKKVVTKSDIEKAERVLALARQQQEQGNLPGQGKGQNSSSKSKAKNKERKVTTETRQENTRMKRSRRQKQDLYYLHNLETFRNFK